MKFAIAVIGFVSAQGAKDNDTLLSGRTLDGPNPFLDGPSATCMHCKLADTAGSFLHSYSYCADTDVCLENQWNFINQWCKTNWI